MAILLLFVQATLQGQGGVHGGAKVEAPGLAPPPTMVSVTVKPSSATVVVGTTQNYTAGAMYSDGSNPDVTDQCAWTSSNTSAAAIGPRANPQSVTAIGVGQTNITCTIGQLSGIGQLTVTSISVLPTVVPAGTDGQPYSVTFTGSGGTAPYHFSITTGLPQLQAVGLNFTSPTLSGTLSASSIGSYSFSVQVTDSSSPVYTASKGFVLTVNSSAAPSRIATLPQVWANPHEADLPNPCNASTHCYTKYIHNATTGGGDFACSAAGLQASMDQWIQTPPTDWWNVVIDDALSPGGRCVVDVTSINGWQLKAKTTGFPTGFLKYTSAHPNTPGQTVCTHEQYPTVAGPSARNPGCNTRPGINDLQHMWGLTSASANIYGPLINVPLANAMDSQGNGFSHIVISNVEIWPTRSGANFFAANIATCQLSTSNCPYTGSMPGSLNQVPGNFPSEQNMCTHVGLEYTYSHSDRDDTGRSPGDVRPITFFVWSCGKSWVEWNYADKISASNAESRWLGLSEQGAGLKIAHNFVECCSFTLIWGGRRPWTGRPPADAEIRQNTLTLNPAWIAQGSQSTACKTYGVTNKNTTEVKTGIRQLWTGNIFENGAPCGQQGQLPTFNVRAGGPEDWVTDISDLKFVSNILRHATNGIQTSSKSIGPGSSEIISLPSRRWNFENNLFYDISTGNGRGGQSQYFILSGGVSGIFLNCTAHRDAAGAVTTLACQQTAADVTNNRNLRTRITVGDPIQTLGCTPTSFNTATDKLGPPALAGTNGLQPQGMTVIYANPGPPNEVTNAGTFCKLYSSQGWNSESLYRHNTFIGNGGIKEPSPMSSSWMNLYERGMTIQDNLNGINPTGWWGILISGFVAGTASQRVAYDVNTLILNHLTFPGKSCSTYTAWPGPVGNEAAGIVGSNAAASLWCPANVACSGATADGTCIGFHGMMNTTSYLINSQNPMVDYQLDPSSLYKAGNARQASDGTDLGVDFNALQRALTETEYSGCSTVPTDPNYCGPTGPFPD